MSTASNIQEILLLKELPEGWDGEKSLAFSEETIQNTVNIVTGLIENSVLEITPNSNATVSLEWEFTESSYIHLVVGKTRASMYVKLTGAETEFFNYETVATQISEIISDVNRFIR